MQTNIQGITKTLASKSDGQRRQVLTEQLSKFAQCTLEERTQAVASLFEGICNLPDAECGKVAKSHLQCLCELPGQSRQQLLPLHVQMVKAAPLKHRLMQIGVAKELIPALTAEQRGIIQQFLSQISS